MLLHDAHDLFSLRRELALLTATRGDAADVYGQSRFVQRSARRLGSVDAAPRTASAVIGAAIDGLLLGARTEGAVDLRLKAASAHLAHRRIELRARLWIERLDTMAAERARLAVNFA